MSEMAFDADSIGGFQIATPNCRGCGQPLAVENAWMTDGCPCNSALGVNSMNETRWRLLMELQQRQSTALAAERAAREAAEAKLSAITAMGDVVQQASAWLAVKAALDDAGMLSFIGGNGTGKSRAVEFVKHLRSQLASVTAERDEAREGYHVLDRNWDAHHEACMKALLGALGLPDATVPEACQAIAARDAELARLRERLTNAWDRMDRARNILTKGNPTPMCNWGMLDTSLDRAALTESEATNG